MKSTYPFYVLCGSLLLMAQHGTVLGEPVMCTAEAKLCPNGQSVGRDGPNCTFAACPSSSSSSSSSGSAGSAGGEVYACQADAKLCPNGEYVGREGRNCTFAACKTSSALSTSTFGKSSVLGITIAVSITLVAVAAQTLL